MGIKALLVYPEMPPTYWSMRYALPFLGRKATLPPLGLLTVAALLPRDWELRLIDENVSPLRDRDLEEADLVLVSAMLIQRPAFERLIARCRRAEKPVVAGGPYPTSCHRDIQGVDHFVLGEAEVNLPPFLADWARGRAKPCYDDPAHPDLVISPLPKFELANRRDYAGAAIQFSRGCPHHCEFCDIVELFGHRPRTKPPERFLAELEALHSDGWRGSLFVVDDNFIGHRAHVRALLDVLEPWQATHGFPFALFTEASIDLAADGDLVDAMVRSGFNMVFVGIETPDAPTLAAVGKQQNTRLDLQDSIRTLQQKGLEVSGGFIVGFDSDPDDIFERQIRFIGDAAIPTAMVGLLTALPNTRLQARMIAEGRMAGTTAGNNTHDLDLNFRPRMEEARLREGYARLLEELYRPSRYFARCLELLRRMKRRGAPCRRVRWPELRAFGCSLIRQSCSRYGFSYVSYLLRGLLRWPRMAGELVAMAVKGHHFFTITQGLLEAERFKRNLDILRAKLAGQCRPEHEGAAPSRTAWDPLSQRALRKVERRFRRLGPDLQERLRPWYDAFLDSLKTPLAAGSAVSPGHRLPRAPRR